MKEARGIGRSRSAGRSVGRWTIYHAAVASIVLLVLRYVVVPAAGPRRDLRSECLSSLFLGRLHGSRRKGQAFRGPPEPSSASALTDTARTACATCVRLRRSSPLSRYRPSCRPCCLLPRRNGSPDSIVTLTFVFNFFFALVPNSSREKSGKLRRFASSALFSQNSRPNA